MRKYQYYNTNDDDDRDAYGVNWQGQTFTPTDDHVIGLVKLKLFRVGDPGTVTVSIKATSGGKPVGADLCSGTIEGTDLTTNTNGEWYIISLGDGFDLDIGAQYAIVVRAPDGDASNKVSWRADITSPTYTGGLQCGSSDSGVDWSTYSGVDCMFEEWGVGPMSPNIVAWGNLPKSQISAEKIEAAILRMIQDHEDDPDAHLEAGESLQSHKASEIIDHVASSIIEDKIKDGEIANPKLDSQARAYTAIVDAGGDADYTDIQDAIDYVNGLGGGNILIKNGTYTITEDIVLYSNINLIGEDKDDTIIDFNSTHHRIYIYHADTIKNVEISKLKIKNWQYNASYGANRGAISILYAENVTVKDCYFQNNDDPVGNIYGDIYIFKASRVYVRDNYCLDSDDCSINIEGSGGYETYHTTISGNYWKGGTGVRIRATYTHYLKIIDNTSVDPEFLYSPEHLNKAIITGNHIACNASITTAIHIIGGSNTKIIGNSITGLEEGYGIIIEDSSRVLVDNNSVLAFGVDGIKIIESNNTIITGNYIWANGAWGVNITNIASNDTIITSNWIIANTSGQIDDNGTDTEIAHNIETT